jgi:hypothetical protein
LTFELTVDDGQDTDNTDTDQVSAEIECVDSDPGDDTEEGIVG